MKIAKIHLVDHPFFNTMDIDFTGPDGKALDTVVITGINGTGKTTLLLAILEILTGENNDFVSSFLEMDISHLPGYEDNGKIEVSHKDFVTSSGLWHDKFKNIDENIRPKVIYMPPQVNFEGLKTRTLSFVYQYRFKNIVNRETTEDVPSFIASTIHGEVFRKMDLPAKIGIEKVCNEMNSLFDILDIDSQMVGLNPEGEKLPIFKNSAGKVFDIDQLSSGEKQLFVRAMALRMLNANNAIILIDEPEIVMHSQWQQRILRVYETIGKNNQIIAATRSPNVISSVERENVKLLKRQNGHINIVG